MFMPSVVSSRDVVLTYQILNIEYFLNWTVIRPHPWPFDYNVSQSFTKSTKDSPNTQALSWEGVSILTKHLDVRGMANYEPAGIPTCQAPLTISHFSYFLLLHTLSVHLLIVHYLLFCQGPPPSCTSIKFAFVFVGSHFCIGSANWHIHKACISNRPHFAAPLINPLSSHTGEAWLTHSEE